MTRKPLNRAIIQGRPAARARSAKSKWGSTRGKEAEPAP